MHNGHVYGNVINVSQPPRSPSATRRDNEALLKASSEGKTEQVSTLIANGSSPNYADRLGFTALHHACLSGQEETARALIETHNADINAVSGKYGGPLCLAALNGHRRVVAVLIEKGASVKARGGHLGSALHAACFAGDVDIITMLLEGGAPVDFVSTIQWYTGAELHVIDPNSLLPAEQGGPPSAFKLDQCSPLHVAAMNENADALRTLLYRGAEPDVVAHGSVTAEASGIAVTFKCSALLITDTPACISALLDAGADIEQTDKRQATPMMIAASNGNLPVLKLYIARGANLEARTEYSDTALHTAALGGKNSCVRYLLAHGADMTAKNDWGQLPVMSAVLGGRRQCVAIFTEFWKSSLNNTNPSYLREYTMRDRHVPFDINDTISMLQDLRVDINSPFRLAGDL